MASSKCNQHLTLINAFIWDIGKRKYENWYQSKGKAADQQLIKLENAKTELE